MKKFKYIVTSYKMGQPMTSRTVYTEHDAHLVAQTLPAYGLPGSGKGAAGMSRVVGIKRVAV